MTHIYFTCSVFTEMQIMIHDQDEEALLAFVKENAGSSTATNGDGWTALHEAAYFGELGCLQILIESKTITTFKQIPLSTVLRLLISWCVNQPLPTH